MNAKISDYTIVSEHSADALIQKVAALLKQGYEPLDGVQVVAPVLHGEEVATLYLQTMVRRAMA
jgi:hypothetical protein